MVSSILVVCVLFVYWSKSVLSLSELSVSQCALFPVSLNDTLDTSLQATSAPTADQSGELLHSSRSIPLIYKFDQYLFLLVDCGVVVKI